MGNKGKFFVGNEFRTNKLSTVPSSVRAEVHAADGTIKIYDNIHYPSAFFKKVFKENPTYTKIEFVDVSDGNKWTITNGKTKGNNQ